MRNVSHLSELKSETSDSNILSQSTKFRDRLFLPTKSERQNVCDLVTCKITMQDFVETSEMRSPNSQLIIELVRHILIKFPDEMPQCYRNLLSNISKPCSVRALLQVNELETLSHLQQFCLGNLNLRSCQSQQQLQSVAKSLPAVWPDLDQISIIENSEFLPPRVV